MISMSLFDWRFASGLGLLVALPLATTCRAQPTSVASAKAHLSSAQPGDESPTADDAYQVPAGTPEELLHYIERGSADMKPRSREQLVLMLESIDTAAQRVYDDQSATPQQRFRAARQRINILNTLTRVGHAQADNRLREFVDRASQDRTTRIQTFAKSLRMKRRIAAWSQLSAHERDEVVADLRQSIGGPEVGREQIGTLIRFADTVARTPDAPVAIELIGEVLPRLSAHHDPAVAARVPRLEGIARRLQLPGNELEIEGTLLSGEQVDWSSYRGKVVLVVFWATWAGPCNREVAQIAVAYDQYHDRGFDVLGVSLDTEKARVQEFLADRNIPWETLFSDDPQTCGWDHPMAVKYGINGIPRAILVDRQGRVIHVNARGETLTRALAELLGPVKQASGESEKTAQAGS